MKKRWIYGVYSSTVIRFNEEKAQIFKKDVLEWTAIEELNLYRRVTEECDLVSEKEAQKIVLALTSKKDPFNHFTRL